MTFARTKIGIRRLRRSELPLDTVALARFLIGKTLVHDLPHVRLSGRIVETEAYLVGDAACHAFRGQTPRNGTLFGERGHAYVYFIYGTHYMLNISGNRKGIGEGILFRALEPLGGIAWMQHHRSIKPSTKGSTEASRQRALVKNPLRASQHLRASRKRSTSAVAELRTSDRLPAPGEQSLASVTDLARGPGRLAAALRITPSLNGLDLTAKSSPLWLGTATKPTGEIGVSVRIGINVAADRLLRFYERGNPFVSGPRRLNP